MKKMKEYQHHYGIKARAYPSLWQEQKSREFGNAARFSYNKIKGTNDEIHLLKKSSDYVPVFKERIEYLKDSISSTRKMKNAFPFLQTVPSHVIENERIHYQNAWNNYHKGKAKKPTFHKKGYEYSFSVNPSYPSTATHMNDCKGCYIIDEGHIQVEGLGIVKVRFSKKLIKRLLNRTAETRLGTFTISKDATNKYYVSIQLASDEPFVDLYKKTGSIDGIDLNIENFQTNSYGEVVENKIFLKKSELKLKQEQRKLSKMADRAKKEGRKLSKSKNYQKQRLKVAELHKHIASQRRNFHHEVAANELKSHDFVFAEDLKVNNMLKNHKLAKAISDVGWRSYLIILEQKAQQRGKFFGLVPPHYTTQTCNSCGYVLQKDERLNLKQRDWVCPKCGEYHIRDENAALNIKNRGIEIYL